MTGVAIDPSPRRAGTERSAGDPSLPTPMDGLLLRAALLPGEPGRVAWEAWSREVDLEATPYGSTRLFPLLHHAVSRRGEPASPLVDTLLRFRLQSWARGQRILRDAARIFARLRAAGIPCTVLKGAALALLDYGDWDQRSMIDIDVLVPAPRVGEVFALLVADGWRSVYGEGRRLETLVRVVHSCSFRHAETGLEVDVHWHALLQCCTDASDEELCEGAVPLDLHGVAVRAFAPTARLFHVCVHGYLSNVYNHARDAYWAADAVVILRARRAEVDWERLVALARKRRVGWALGRALGYLVDELDAPVAPQVLAQLSGCEPVGVERLEALAGRIQWDRGRLLVLFACRWLRLRQREDMRGIRGLLEYLRCFWDLDRTSHVPGVALRKVARNLGHGVAWALARGFRASGAAPRPAP